MGCSPIPEEELLGSGENYPQNILINFIPAVQPFVNEGCNTSWDNLSAIVQDGEIIYFSELPDYTDNPLDYDKSRFTFIFQAKNPFYGYFDGENPYTRLQTGWYTLPVDDYGSLTCEGLQEIRIWVLDENTDEWYMNSQVCWAGYLCNGQEPCNQGYGFADIDYVSYSDGQNYNQPSGYTEY